MNKVVLVISVIGFYVSKNRFAVVFRSAKPCPWAGCERRVFLLVQPSEIRFCRILSSWLPNRLAKRKVVSKANLLLGFFFFLIELKKMKCECQKQQLPAPHPLVSPPLCGWVPELLFVSSLAAR